MRVVSCSFWVAVLITPAAADRAGDCNQQKDPDLAIRACTELITRNPAIDTLFYNRGNAYAAKGQYDRAIADYAASLKIDPKQADTHHNIGLARQMSGQVAQAIKDYTAALKLNPRHESALYNRGVTYAQLQDNARAIDDFTNAIRLAPKARTYFSRVSAYERRGNVPQAISDYQSALRIDPQLSAAKSALQRLQPRK